jgi:uncharacterized protein YggE
MNTDSIRITCKGTHATVFTEALLKASVTTYGKTGPEAKEAAKKTIEALRNVIFDHMKLASIEADRIKTSFHVDVHRTQYNVKPEGYKATYTIAFVARDVVQAIALHDKLTSIEDVQSPTPIFRTDESPEIQARAFADAVSKAERKFKDQCTALGLSPDDYAIQAWETDEDRDRDQGVGKTLNMTGETIWNAVGKAMYDVTLTVAFSQRRRDM